MDSAKDIARDMLEAIHIDGPGLSVPWQKALFPYPSALPILAMIL